MSVTIAFASSWKVGGREAPVRSSGMALAHLVPPLHRHTLDGQMLYMQVSALTDCARVVHASGAFNPMFMAFGSSDQTAFAAMSFHKILEKVCDVVYYSFTDGVLERTRDMKHQAHLIFNRRHDFSNLCGCVSHVKPLFISAFGRAPPEVGNRSQSPAGESIMQLLQGRVPFGFA